MLKNFAAIDFETANQFRSSVCSVGVVVVEDGKITETIYSLIKPKPNFYTYINIGVHGITRDDTMNAPAFPEIWNDILPHIKDKPLVAHNCVFDSSCLKAVYKAYDMDYPDFEFYCTLKAARREIPSLENYQLHTVASHCGFDLKNHHHALADAEACAMIAINVL